MRIIVQIAVVAGFIAFASCTNKQFYQTYLHKVDSLNSSMEASASAYEQIDTSLVQAQFQKIKMQLDTLISLEGFDVHTTVNEYEYIRKTYKTFLREHTLTLNELKYSRTQLRTLRHDIDKRELEENQVTLYFNQEAKAVSILKERMNIFVENIDARMKRYKLLEPQIDSLIQGTKKKEIN